LERFSREDPNRLKEQIALKKNRRSLATENKGYRSPLSSVLSGENTPEIPFEAYSQVLEFSPERLLGTQALTCPRNLRTDQKVESCSSADHEI
jgi:hypothetical protein